METCGSRNVALGRGQDDVGVGHEVQAPTGADPVHCGDHRLGDAVVPAGDAQLGPFGAARLLAQRVRVAGQLHHIEAGLEAAAPARVHDDADGRVAVELLPRPLELGQHDRVHGVGRLGPVEDEPADVAAPLDHE